MSKQKYENLKEEVEYNVVSVDSERNPRNSSELKIFLRDPFNKTTQISFDNSKIIKIQDLKTHIMKELKIEGNKKIKLIFKGKILEDIKNINEYKIEKDDVLLYMVVEQEIVNNNPNNSEENDTSFVSQHIQNGVENFENRGFNRFRTLGMSSYELNLFRTLFHAIYMSQHRDENIDWSPQAVLQREDEWINNQSPNNPDTGLSQQGIIAQRNLLDNTRLNAGRIIFLRRGINFYNSRVDNNNRTNNNNTNNDQQNINRSFRNNLALRRINQDYNDFFIQNNEPNSRLILGLVIGILLHFYGLILVSFL